MNKVVRCILALSVLATTPLKGEEPAATTSQQTFFKPFTGKVVKNKVRLRTQASLEAPIVKELEKDDLFLVVGESDDFYAVAPPKNSKAYIFRTFVLDNQVEGTKVNVRLKPDVDAPVIAQLNTGDHVEGAVTVQNSKWLEITPPASTKFYVSKDFIERIGDANLIVDLSNRLEKVKQLLQETIQLSETEFQKPFEQINVDPIVANLHKVLYDYADFPQEVIHAKNLLKNFEDRYMQMKIAYLESKAANSSQNWQAANEKLVTEIKTQQDKLADLETQLQNTQNANTTRDKPITPIHATPVDDPAPLPVVRKSQKDPGANARMAAWQPVEQNLYSQWVLKYGPHEMQDFYKSQKEHGITLRGMVEPYNRTVKNKPGDYVLINSYNNLPVAYLYSTKIDLQNFVGREATFIAAPRPNNNFAYPAYFVIEVE